MHKQWQMQVTLIVWNVHISVCMRKISAMIVFTLAESDKDKIWGNTPIICVFVCVYVFVCFVLFMEKEEDSLFVFREEERV